MCFLFTCQIAMTIFTQVWPIFITLPRTSKPYGPALVTMHSLSVLFNHGIFIIIRLSVFIIVYNRVLIDIFFIFSSSYLSKQLPYLLLGKVILLMLLVTHYCTTLLISPDITICCLLLFTCFSPFHRNNGVSTHLSHFAPPLLFIECWKNFLYSSRNKVYRRLQV